MNVVMARIDDRLIHGQVLVGCCEPLSVRRILLVSAELVANDALREIYLSSVPSDIECRCLEVSDAAHALAETTDALPTLVLAATPSEMFELADANAEIGDVVCLGGLHHGAGRVEELDRTGIYVGPGDLQALRGLRDRGLEVRVQPVPGAKSVDLDELLRSDES